MLFAERPGIFTNLVPGHRSTGSTSVLVDQGDLVLHDLELLKLHAGAELDVEEGDLVAVHDHAGLLHGLIPCSRVARRTCRDRSV